MGDLVLLETEITPVMTKLLDSGLEITAIHNHILRASPATFYMHVAGHGDPEKMATAIRSALSSDSKTPFDPPATTAAAAPAVDLDTAKLDEIMAAKGNATGGVDQFGIPRRIQRPKAAWRSPRAGGANGINFQPTGGGKAAITGDFLVTGDEVDPLIRALRAGDIEVTAIHSHMLDEQPRMFFIHFWANDDAMKLAKACVPRSTRPPWRSVDGTAIEGQQPCRTSSQPVGSCLAGGLPRAACRCLPTAGFRRRAGRWKRKTSVVFVCLHGSVKSQMAAAHFNRIASERGLPHRRLRGIEVDASIPTRIRDGLYLDGLAPSTIPIGLTADEAGRATVVVAFDAVPRNGAELPK